MDDCGGRFAGRADAFDYGIQRRNCADIAGPGWAGGSQCRCSGSRFYSTVVAAAGYVQADFQSVIDSLNAPLNSLRAAGIIAT